jgi:hypothetical protein
VILTAPYNNAQPFVVVRLFFIYYSLPMRA